MNNDHNNKERYKHGVDGENLILIFCQRMNVDPSWKKKKEKRKKKDKNNQ